MSFYFIIDNLILLIFILYYNLPFIILIILILNILSYQENKIKIYKFIKTYS